MIWTTQRPEKTGKTRVKGLEPNKAEIVMDCNSKEHAKFLYETIIKLVVSSQIVVKKVGEDENKN